MKTFRALVSYLPAFIVMLVPILVLVGWSIDSTTLTRVLPQFTPMNPMTAVSFLLVGICMVLSHTSWKKVSNVVFKIVGVWTFIVGAIMLAKYAFGFDFMVDRILFEPKLGINRMALLTAAGFFFLGVSFAITRAFKILIQLLTVFVLSIATYSLIAYLYNFIGVYGVAAINPIAIHTAFLFLVISLSQLRKNSLLRDILVSKLRQKNLLVPATLATVFIIMMIITGGIAILVGSNTKQQSRLRFENQANQITTFVQSRMDLYTNTERGVRGLFAASDEVEEDEWKKYIDKLDVPSNYSGVSGIAFAKKYDAAAIPTLPFEVRPNTQKEYYFPITYTSSFIPNATTSKGFDISSEAMRYQTLLKAIREDAPIATPVVIGTTTNLPVFSVYTPIFANNASITTSDERSINTQGIVIVSFRLEKIFPDLFQNPLFKDHIGVSIFDAGVPGENMTPSLLYEEGTFEKDSEDFTKESLIHIADRTWNMEFIAHPEANLPTIIQYAKKAVLGFGFLFSLLVTMMVASYIRAREKALLGKNAQLEALVQSFPHAVMIVDENHVVVMANQKLATTFGLPGTAENYIGLNALTYIAKLATIFKDFPTFQKQIGELLKNRVAVADQTVELADGRFISWTYIPLNYQDIPHGAVWIYKDITEEKEIDKQKSEFISVASHQLRTPLGSIRWNVELLGEEKNLSVEGKERLKDIELSNARVLTLVGDLLNVTRIEQGRTKPEPADFDLVPEVQGAVTELTPDATKKTIRITTELSSSKIVAHADPKLFREVTQNILSNAVKYTRNGGTINISSLTKNNVEEITISDNGMGIPKEDMKKVFSKFYRSAEATKVDTGGSGLGLFIVKSYVESWGGTIVCESTQNVGTTFRFTIPLAAH